jgi:hypothetical protein
VSHALIRSHHSKIGVVSQAIPLSKIRRQSDASPSAFYHQAARAHRRTSLSETLRSLLYGVLYTS